MRSHSGLNLIENFGFEGLDILADNSGIDVQLELMFEKYKC